MALSIVQLFARSPWRVRAVFAGGTPSGVLAGDFAITRKDGGPCTIAVASLISIDVNALELVLSEATLAGVSYVATWSAAAFGFQFSTPLSQNPAVQPIGDDPEAEAYGVDLAWISDDPHADGDCARRRGVACLEYDLPNRAALIPGELVQDQGAGANLPQQINGSAGNADLVQIASRLEAEFKRDDRVQDAEINTSDGALQGDVNFNGQVLTIATGLPVQVRNT